MTNSKHRFELETTLYERSLRDILFVLRMRYHQLKHVFIILSCIIISYIFISIILIKWSNSGLYTHISFQSILFIVLIFYLKKLKQCIRRYNICYKKGYSLWCRLADTADWSILRRHFYFKSEKLSPIIETIDDFYKEFNKPLSPQRIFNKYLYYIVFTLLLIYILMFAYSIYHIYAL